MRFPASASILARALGLSILAPAGDLSTRYAAEHALKVETETTLKMETTAMEMLRDGEPVEGRGNFGGGGSTERRKSVHVDRFLECADGQPSRLRRSFEAVEGEIEADFGGETRSSSIDSPFSGLTLELSREEQGEVAVEVVDGSAPDEEALAGQALELALDALLPPGDVDAGESWALDKSAVLRALALDVGAGMFPRPQDERPEGRGGGGRGGRGGMRGGSTAQMLSGATWGGRATLKEGLEDQGGTSCALIEIELEAERDLSDGEGTSGSFEAKLQGRLYFAVDARRPVLLELEGSLSSEIDSQREREGSRIEMHRESEGSLAYRVSVTETGFKVE